MSTTKDNDYMDLRNWTLNRDTFEWVHIPSGLSAHDIKDWLVYYEMGMKASDTERSKADITV